MDDMEAAPTPGIGKRPAPIDLEEKPDVKRRNRRMFGALLGTLQQFRKEDAKFKKSEAASKREEALKKAEAKAETTTRELRTKQREDHMARKHAEIEKKKKLILTGNKMRAEISFHRRVEHRRKLVNFIFTKAEPAVLWLPKKHNSATEELHAGQVSGLDAWIEEEGKKFEAEKAELDAQLAELERVAKERMSKDAQGGEDATMEDAVVPAKAEGGDGANEDGGDAQEEEQLPAEEAAMGNGKAAGSKNGEEGSDQELEVQPAPEELDDLLS